MEYHEMNAHSSGNLFLSFMEPGEHRGFEMKLKAIACYRRMLFTRNFNNFKMAAILFGHSIEIYIT